ncbi:MAG: chemotaxis protein CheW [Anaeromyxobacter sp.]|nr:chemotaxis protein CheW [Anaeromyxobacter sp.]MBL0274770.1 chemotaxis protein CheW [Anaeromyxobacter sp.]
MSSLPSERKALLFSVGGVRLALRLSQVREILEVAAGEVEVVARGEPLPSAYVSTVLGLPGGPARYALVTEASPRSALRVEALHGIVDLSAAEVFQLPVHTIVPQPSPYAGALVAGGQVALELAVSSLGFAPIEPAQDLGEPPPSLGPWLEREIRFARGGLTFGVPLSILVQVLESPRLAPVPLTPPSHRGLLHHGRALHTVVDVGVLYGEPPAATPRQVLLLDAGGAGVGVAADRVLAVGEGSGAEDVLRPPWDALFGGT